MDLASSRLQMDRLFDGIGEHENNSKEESGEDLRDIQLAYARFPPPQQRL
jgi:hypothetical protein